MRDRLTLLIAIVLLAGVTGTAYWYATVLRKPSVASARPPGTPDFEADSLVVTQFDVAGRARHRLFAASLSHFAENDNVEAFGPRLVTLRPDRPQVEVRAERALVENAGERVHLYENVVLTRAAAAATPPMRVESDYMMALPDLDQYATDQPVAVQRGASRITASQGMKIDNIARTAQFDGKVQISLPPRAGQP